jgi:hypothetical protein
VTNGVIVLISPSQHIAWNREVDLLCGLVDDEIELLRLFDWKVSWFGSLQALVHKNGGAPVQF